MLPVLRHVTHYLFNDIINEFPEFPMSEVGAHIFQSFLPFDFHRTVMALTISHHTFNSNKDFEDSLLRLSQEIVSLVGWTGIMSVLQDRMSVDDWLTLAVSRSLWWAEQYNPWRTKWNPQFSDLQVAQYTYDVKEFLAGGACNATVREFSPHQTKLFLHPIYTKVVSDPSRNWTKQQLDNTNFQKIALRAQQHFTRTKFSAAFEGKGGGDASGSNTVTKAVRSKLGSTRTTSCGDAIIKMAADLLTTILTFTGIDSKLCKAGVGEALKNSGPEMSLFYGIVAKMADTTSSDLEFCKNVGKFVFEIFGKVVSIKNLFEAIIGKMSWWDAIYSVVMGVASVIGWFGTGGAAFTAELVLMAGALISDVLGVIGIAEDCT